jgi:hypothetical protein
MPDPSDPLSSKFFRYPRQFLGSIYYDRLPCKPFMAFGKIKQLPCPVLPTNSPTLPQPSASPVTIVPAQRPVSQVLVAPTPFIGTPAHQNPTVSPTISPTSSTSPSFPPSTNYPTGMPIVPMRASFAINLRNVPERSMSER